MQRSITLAGAAITLFLIAETGNAQISEQTFRGGRMSDLAALCSASGQEALDHAALGYCQGFVVAAGQYHRALSAEGSVQRPNFCLPNPSPTFDQARTALIAWAKANPQYGAEPAIDGLMRFAAEAYPCPAAAAPRSRR